MRHFTTYELARCGATQSCQYQPLEILHIRDIYYTFYHEMQYIFSSSKLPKMTPIDNVYLATKMQSFAVRIFSASGEAVPKIAYKAGVETLTELAAHLI